MTKIRGCDKCNKVIPPNTERIKLKRAYVIGRVHKEDTIADLCLDCFNELRLGVKND